MTRTVTILALCLALAGCGQRDLSLQRALSVAYHDFCDMYGRGPADAKQLRDFTLAASRDRRDESRAVFMDKALKALDAVDRGDSVVVYGIFIQKVAKEADLSKIVLIYDKDVPSNGGPVVMADGSVKTLTADEFAKAPKAGK